MVNSLEEQIRRALLLSNKNPDDQLIQKIADRVQNENIDIFDALIDEGVQVHGIHSSYVSDNQNVGVDEQEGEDGVREMAGLPVINEDGERLAFINPKGSDVIHVAKEEQPDDDPAAPPGMTGRAPKTYRWSECGMGSSRGKNKENAIYLNEEDLDGEYIQRNGDVVGKLCGNCRKALD